MSAPNHVAIEGGVSSWNTGAKTSRKRKGLGRTFSADNAESRSDLARAIKQLNRSTSGGSKRVKRSSRRSSTPRLDKVVETTSLRAILPEITKDTVVLLDLDNNVVKTVQQLASDQWFRWRIADAKEKGESFESALDDWTMLMFKTRMEPAEPDVDAIVSEIQRRCLTLAVTSRGMRLGTRTVTQLKETGIDFTVNAPTDREIFWPRGLNGNAEHVLYEKGILFSAGQNKGLAMKKLFDELDIRPKKVIFADDSRSHVEHVREACAEQNIPFVGFHNVGLQNWVESLDSKITNVQYAGFSRILSDEEAKARLDSDRD